MSFLLLHIIASSLLVLLIVVRFLIITFAGRPLTTFRLPILLTASLTLLSGFSLLFTATLSITHLCTSAAGIIVLVMGAEVWLRTMHFGQYSKDS